MYMMLALKFCMGIFVVLDTAGVPIMPGTELCLKQVPVKCESSSHLNCSEGRNISNFVNLKTISLRSFVNSRVVNGTWICSAFGALFSCFYFYFQVLIFGFVFNKITFFYLIWDWIFQLLFSNYQILFAFIIFITRLLMP